MEPTLTEAAGAMVPDTVTEAADAEVLLDVDVAPELTDDPDVPLDIWVIEEMSALIVDDEE